MLNNDKENIYFALDFETGGRSPETHSIVEFGIAIIKDFKVIDSVGSLVRPYSEIDPKFLEYSGIKQSDLNDCGFTIQDMVTTIVELCDGFNPTHNKYKRPYLVGHNIYGFDLKWLAYAFKLCNLDWENYFGYIIYDTLPLSAMIFYDNIKIKDKKLGTICRYVGVELLNAHSAEDDAIMVGNLFIKCLKFYSKKFDKTEFNNL